MLRRHSLDPLNLQSKHQTLAAQISSLGLLDTTLQCITKIHQTKTHGLGSLKQVSSNPLPKENTRLNSHFKILTRNLKNTSLVFYLKTIGENVDPSARITFLKTD